MGFGWRRFVEICWKEREIVYYVDGFLSLDNC